ncbi:10561_t:CDS:2 [Ambispora gerdemannii]|uniref:10561_t:CDS:1 n=1 Tax=Ambispora gerdemannii TaxID=144530 RepID=A0A9N8VXH2_9GLOM|nr:10561_t:CDS:2 [Ambispora gerdemannii]
MIVESRNSRDSYYSSILDDYGYNSSSSHVESATNLVPTRFSSTKDAHKRRPSLNIAKVRDSISSLKRQPSYDFPSPSTSYFSATISPRVASPLVNSFNYNRDSIAQNLPTTPSNPPSYIFSHYHHSSEDRRYSLGASSTESYYSRRMRKDSKSTNEIGLQNLVIPPGHRIGDTQHLSSPSGSSTNEDNGIYDYIYQEMNKSSSASSYEEDILNYSHSLGGKGAITAQNSSLTARKTIRMNHKNNMNNDGHQAPIDPDRDQYGFKRSYQWISQKEYADFESIYSRIQQRRKVKWDALLTENGGNLPGKSSKIKRYIRKGIPPSLRGRVWFHYSGAAEKMRNQPDLYEKLLQKAAEARTENEYVEIIERDLHRTFPENIKFKSSVSSDDGSSPTIDTENVPIIQSLRRVLVAFSLYSPNIGYCQSLNYIAGLLLLFMEEKQAFWTLVAIIHDYLPENMYDMTMEGANVDQAVLMKFIIDKMPHMWGKLSAGIGWDPEKVDSSMPTITLVTSHWFLTLYINILPIETMLRVWDCFFYERHKVLFRVALAIFKINEEKILAVDDPMEVFQVVQNMPKRLIDCHKLMEVCFRRRKVMISDISRKEIDRQRDYFRERRKQRLGSMLNK